MTTRLGKLVAAASVIIAVLAASSESEAQGLTTPIGTINACGVLSTVTLNSNILGNTSFTASGTAKFKTVAPNGPRGLESTSQEPVSLSATGNSAELGDITWSFAGSSRASTITAQQPGSSFPATANLYFNVQATFSNGDVYQSIGEVHLKNENLNSFNPQNGETYQLASGPVAFEQIADADGDPIPGGTVFTIPVMTVVVSAASQNQGGN